MADDPEESARPGRGLAARLRGRHRDEPPPVDPPAAPLVSWMPPEAEEGPGSEEASSVDEPAATDEPAPVENASGEEAPAERVEEAPAERVEEAPFEPAEQAPNEPAEQAPDEPAEPDEPAPAQSTERAAALAYCRVLVAAPASDEAAADAFSAYESATAFHGGSTDEPAPAAEPPAGELLLAITRLMTAVTLPDPSSPDERRRAVRDSIGEKSHCTCRESPLLLAARRNGTIDARGSDALDAHLSACAACRELAARIEEAEAGFREALAGGEDPGGVSPEAAPPR